jgi:hypothetical protein
MKHGTLSGSTFEAPSKEAMKIERLKRLIESKLAEIPDGDRPQIRVLYTGSDKTLKITVTGPVDLCAKLGRAIAAALD